MRLRLSILLFCLTQSALAAMSSPPFLQEHEQLKRYLFEEPTSKIYLGMGLSPIAVLSSRILFSLDIFQIHLMTHRWDLEILSASFGYGLAKDSLTSSRQIVLRSTPKIRLGSFFSLGPIIGLEYVGFPNVDTKIYKGTQFTPQFEPFSQASWIYGLAFSETFHLNDGYLLKVNEFIYRENYSNQHTYNGWQFFFNDPGLEGDPTPLAPSTVIGLEFALLF